MAANEKALNAVADERDAKRELGRSLRVTLDGLKARIASERALQAEEAKQIDRLLARRGLLQHKVDEFQACIRKLGSIPKDALGEIHRTLSAKALLEMIDECQREVGRLGHVRTSRSNLHFIVLSRSVS